MADWAKIAIKAGLIAVIMVALWAVFTQIQFPNLDYSQVFSGVGVAMALITYWCPIFPTIWVLVLSMATIWLSLYTFRFAMIGVRWLMKVNE